MQPAALAGLHVVDLTNGPAGGLATAVLADFGAEVTKVEPPGGDPFRTLPSSAFWLRGKGSVVADLDDPADHDAARALARAADVVVVSGPPSRLRRWRLDGPTFAAESPHTVHCTITGWGTSGPYAELPGWESLVAAKAGRMASFDVQLDSTRPVYAAVQVATHIAGQAAVHGIIGALDWRERYGTGQLVETSLLQALLPLDLVDGLSVQLADRGDTPYVPLRKLTHMPTLNYHPVLAADGRWIQCGNLLEHLFYSFLGAVGLLDELLVEERFQAGPAEWSAEVIDEARDRILRRIRERPSDEWMRVFAADGNVAAEPIVTCDEAIRHRDLVEGGHLVVLDDPERGPTTQIGPIAELVETPGSPDRPAPPVGPPISTTTPAPRNGDDRPRTPAGSGANCAGRPLDGVAILDLSTIIAGPLGMSMLADLGARVIKVEPLGGDPFRHLLSEGRLAVKTNLGKESIGLDLKKPEGQTVLHELAAAADVVVHNFRGDVPARLGVDRATLQAHNPTIITAVVNGYGPHGPSALRPATHPVMGAASGGVAHQAGVTLATPCESLGDIRETARRLMAANDANPDPNTSVVLASAVLIALLARRRGRPGQHALVNMQVANAWANHDDFIDYEGKPPRRPVDAEHRGIDALQRLYPTRSGWVFLAAGSDAAFASLCHGLGAASLASDPRFATDEARREHDTELGASIEGLLTSRDADAWEARLTALGVGCVRADGVDVGRFVTDDPHLLANGWAPTAVHAHFGSHRRWGPIVTVGGPAADYGSAPLLGEHTDRLLSELGHDASAISDLRERRIVA